jgi:Cft2 family RNA processing exonuclease
MNAAIRHTALTRNPFEFKFIRNLAEGSQLLSDPQPCVVMASPGMLQSGFSRQLLGTYCHLDSFFLLFFSLFRGVVRGRAQRGAADGLQRGGHNG